MPEPAKDQQRQRALEFIKDQLSLYYHGAELKLPPGFERREFGFFMYGGKGMVRPVAFSSVESIRRFLAERTPAHAYFSSAYYERPEVPMADKKWLGADLVFDLDADHIPGAEKMTYEQMLAKVKSEFERLIDDFLVRDFGFRDHQMEVVFSGGRGYHLHVRDEDVKLLDASQRRAIVDYITGRNMEWGQISFGTLRVGAGGWRGKVARKVIEMLEEMDKKPEREAVGEIADFPGVGKTTARRLFDKRRGIIMRLRDLDDSAKIEYMKAANPSLDTEKLRQLVETEGALDGDLLSGKREQTAFFERLVKGMAVGLIGGETDEPVTADVKRLIRMPTSIHGKSSFRVCPLTMRGLRKFDPLHDALAFPGESVAVEGLGDAEISLKGDVWRVKKGERAEMPLYAAMFFLCRGAAAPMSTVKNSSQKI